VHAGAGGNWDGRVFLNGIRKTNSFASNNAIVARPNP